MIILGSFSPFLHKNMCCGYSLEVPQRGTSNEYPIHILWRNKKKLSLNYQQILFLSKFPAHDTNRIAR